MGRWGDGEIKITCRFCGWINSVKYPNLLRWSWGFPTTTQLKDGFIRLRSFPLHRDVLSVPRNSESYLPSTGRSPPSADPYILFCLATICLDSFLYTSGIEGYLRLRSRANPLAHFWGTIQLLALLDSNISNIQQLEALFYQDFASIL